MAFRFLAVVVFAFLSSMALAQNYPNKPIRIHTASAGGGNDLISRIIAAGIQGSIGQPVVVENKGAGFIMAEAFAKLPADGYTLMLQSSGVWLAPFLTDNVRYDPVRDLASVTIADKSPSVIVVHPSLPVNSLKELIALAKARPGTLNWSSGNNGSTGHLAGELFKVMTGANIVRIPYKSGGQETADLVSGVVQMAFNPAGSVMTQVKAGKLRALAVANSKPSTLTPGVPTTAEAGLSGYEMEVTHAVFAPAGTPAAIINLVNQEMVRFLRLPDTREKLLVQGVEPVGSTPEEMSVFIKADMARLGKLIKDLGIRAD
jgi:tripartite-type tricarboxylate transporter receptor subunit TctC